MWMRFCLSKDRLIAARAINHDLGPGTNYPYSVKARILHCANKIIISLSGVTWDERAVFIGKCVKSLAYQSQCKVSIDVMTEPTPTHWLTPLCASSSNTTRQKAA